MTFGTGSFDLSKRCCGGGTLVDAPASRRKAFSTFVEDGLVYEGVDFIEGATVDGGGVKNERSSNVSRKSLYVIAAFR